VTATCVRGQVDRFDLAGFAALEAPTFRQPHRHHDTRLCHGGRGVARATLALPHLPDLSPEFQEDPHRLLRLTREQSPVATDPFGLVALSYDAVRTVLRDRRFHSPDAFGLAIRGVTSDPLWDWAARQILSLNGEDHHRLRRPVVRAFTPARAASLHAVMTAVITELTDPVSAAGRCDIVTEVARPYPIPVICELLGAPRQDWRLFSAWADDFFTVFRLDAADHAPAILHSADELGGYIDQMAARRRHAPGDDLISSLIRAEDDGDRLSHDELLTLAGALLVGGTDTTRNQLAAAVQVFCDHPDQWACSPRDPSWRPKPSRKPCATPRPSSAPSASPSRTSSWPRSRSRPEPGSPPAPPPPTATRPSTPTPTPSTSPASPPSRCSPSAAAPTTASACTWPRPSSPPPPTVLARRMPRIRRTGPAPWKPLWGISGPITLPVQFDPGH
jgi:cytochrome P450